MTIDRSDGGCPATRRGFLAGAAGAVGAAGMTGVAPALARPPLIKTGGGPGGGTLPFYGEHQNGIVTPMQAHTYFAAFDVVSDKRADLVALLQVWTETAARLTQGLPASVAVPNVEEPATDSGEVAGLPPRRLTLTFGFGASLFTKDGRDRFGIAAHRPAAFVDLPHFVGDQLVPERTGGDLSVQACGDDPQANLHAIRQLARAADGIAQFRWVQSGFVPGYAPDVTPRNLMGFKDGTINVPPGDAAATSRYLWVGDEGGAWMRGGTYVVARPIRIALEHWDRMKLGFQEQTIGRHKASGAPIGGAAEFQDLDLDAVDKDGNSLIAENAHARLAAPQSNDGAQILRRSYSYDNGLSFVAERWPPWRQGLELDAGLLFVCYQRDPRTGFIRIFDRMSKFDMLNQFVTHIGGGLFACPGACRSGEFIGQDLFAHAV